jgi:6-phosphogluconolactonase
MNIEILPDIASLAKRAAAVIAADARTAVQARGRFIMAVSGGKTPWVMLRELANEEVPWANVHVFQIDERIAPAGDPDRNYEHLRATLLENAPIPEKQIYAMPVEQPDVEAAARQYAQLLEGIAGKPPVLDLAHLGLGPDGHTASLVPNDPVLSVTDRDVAITGVYQNRRRMTLTYPVLNRSRKILWLVSGKDKVPAFAKLRAADPSIPGGRIGQVQALMLADQDAAGEASGASA